MFITNWPILNQKNKEHCQCQCYTGRYSDSLVIFDIAHFIEHFPSILAILKKRMKKQENTVFPFSDLDIFDLPVPIAIFVVMAWIFVCSGIYFQLFVVLAASFIQRYIVRLTLIPHVVDLWHELKRPGGGKWSIRSPLRFLFPSTLPVNQWWNCMKFLKSWATFCLWEDDWDYFLAFYFFFISLRLVIC